MIHGTAAAAMIAGWLGVSLFACEFAMDEFAATAAFVCVLAILYWMASRLTRVLRAHPS